MTNTGKLARTLLVAFTTLVVTQACMADEKGFEFFETHIRPVLVDRCYECHSAKSETIEGDLELDSSAGLRKGGSSGPIVDLANVDASLLMRAIRHEDDVASMPPDEDQRLSGETVAAFRQWIAMGAPDPRDANTRTAQELDWEQRKKHWAFQPPVAKPLPEVEQADWPRDSIDSWVLAKLEANGMQPNEDASRATLIRRLYADLIGLPPTADDVTSFVSDDGTDATERLVDRLLASPRFGERWARHWLDVVRFAESSGKEFNFTYPHAWPYRDYVIQSLNDDKPYDQFVREQLAGDLLTPPPYENETERQSRLVATSVLSFGTKRHNSSGMAFRMEMVDDQIDVTCRAILGLTVACAKCHDHKFDAISTKEYYSLAGIFLSTEPLYGTLRQKYSNTPTDLLPYGHNAQAQHEALAAFKERLAAAQKPRDEKKSAVAKVEKEKKDAEAAHKSLTSKLEKSQADKTDDTTELEKQLDSAADSLAKSVEKLDKLNQELKALETAVSKLEEKRPPTPGYAMSVRDRPKPADTKVALRGNFRSAGEVAPRGFLTALNVEDVTGVNAKQSGRMELAQWMTSRQNPLTARVLVNRLWHHLFGRGIVSSVDNFGIMGSKPTHPELLDQLAIDFIDDGWSIKRMIRRIVLSRVYRLSCEADDRNMRYDADNRLLWRSSPRRVPVEVLRDSILAVSGQLNVDPPVGSTVTPLGDQMVRGVDTKKLQPPSNHRSVFLPVIRDYAPTMFDRFDFPSSALVSGKRSVTNTPEQALFLRNSEFIQEQSEFAAKRVLEKLPEADEAQRLEFVMLQMFARTASKDEQAQATQLLSAARESVAEPEEKEVAAWSSLFQSLFATAEFRYLVDVDTTSH